MKTFDERKQSVQNHMRMIRRRRRKVFSITLSATLTLAVFMTVLFVPYDTTPPDVSKYAGSEYYGLIQKLNAATYQKPEHKNRFQALGDFFEGLLPVAKDEASGEVAPHMMNAPTKAPTYDGGTLEENPDQYHETTDNQVAGVIESDIIKRSDKYIYYLREHTLYIYSINGFDSCLVGEYSIDPYLFMGDKEDPNEIRYSGMYEMYLSQDCKTITVVARCYHSKQGSQTMLLNLDVADPANVRVKDYACFDGYYLSSRLVDGQILLSYQYNLNEDQIDFDDPATYVPRYEVNGNEELIGSGNIVCPEDPAVARYTVLCMVSGEDLQVTGSVALMDYNTDMYVSADAVYLMRSYPKKIPYEENGNGWYKNILMTEITGVSYGAEGLQILGTAQLEGSVKDQYSMDQHEGILRVVTSTSVTTVKEYRNGNSSGISRVNTMRNVNLYCVDLSTWQIRASVLGFAPEGEDAQSVRFDGAHAYVCTAEVITMTDPVYFFDLSDLDHITYTDTGTIEGYSTSLIQLGDGYLLGIGYGDNRDMLKLEVYAQQDGKVVSVCDYQLQAVFSSDNKAYFIDRERDLIGLGILTYENGRQFSYILLHFDGTQLVQVLKSPMAGNVDHCRAVLVNDFFYILGSDKTDFYIKKFG